MGRDLVQAQEQPHEVDSRELEPDFQRLPPEVQALRRAHWVDQGVAGDRILALEHTKRRRAVCEGLASFAVVAVALAFLTGWSNVAFFSSLPVGCAVGLVWFRSGAGILLSPAITMLASLLHQGLLFPLGDGHIVDLLISPFLLGLMSAYLGLQRDFGRPS